MLESEGYEILVASNGHDALETAKSLPGPDLILLDIMMIGIDGFEVCKQLKADMKLSRIPVIFISALANEEEKIRGFREGAVDYITKPFHIEEVLARVSTHVQFKKHRDNLQLMVEEQREKYILAKAALEKSEELHRSILEAAIEGFCMMDIQGRIMKVNEACCRITGYSENELLSMNITDLEANEKFEDIALHFKKIISEGADRFETRHRRKDGTIFDIEVSAQYRSLNGGEIFGFFRDITQRKMAENEILISKKFSESIVNSLPGIFYVFDRKGKFVKLNERFLRVSGYSMEEALNMHPIDFFGVDEKKRVEERIRETFEKGESSVEADFTSKCGKKTPYYFTGYCAIIDNVPLLVGVGIDITERRFAEEALTAGKESAEAYSKAKTQFLANVSHDIRTPMHAIMGFTNMLDAMKSDKESKIIEIIKKNSKVLMALVDELLDISKVESGSMVLRSDQFNLKEFVDSVVENAMFEVQGKDVKIFNEYKFDMEFVEGDAPRLGQIMGNILNNAIKYTDSGEIRIFTEATTDPSDPNKCRMKVSIKDTGLGIPNDKINMVFEPFTRFHEFKGGKMREGSGLGLYIAKTLIDMMGGMITVVSEVGVGSTFYFEVNLNIAGSV
jgi:PAS domain S-box-containing protein